MAIGSAAQTILFPIPASWDECRARKKIPQKPTGGVSFRFVLSISSNCFKVNKMLALEEEMDANFDLYKDMPFLWDKQDALSFALTSF